MLIDMQAQKNGIDFTVHIAPEIYEHPFVYGSPLHLRHALDCGMNAHLAKPLDVEKMIHTIALYL